jgi:hypothetical protein
VSAAAEPTSGASGNTNRPIDDEPSENEMNCTLPSLLTPPSRPYDIIRIPFAVSFMLTEQEVIDVCLTNYREQHRAPRCLEWWFAAVMVAAGTLFSFATDALVSWGLPLLTLGGVAFSTIVFRLWCRSATRVARGLRSQAKLLGRLTSQQQTITLTRTTFHLTLGQSQLGLPWRSIEAVHNTARWIIIVANTQAFHLPKRVFASPRLACAFGQVVLHRTVSARRQ